MAKFGGCIIFYSVFSLLGNFKSSYTALKPCPCIKISHDRESDILLDILLDILQAIQVHLQHDSILDRELDSWLVWMLRIVGLLQS